MSGNNSWVYISGFQHRNYILYLLENYQTVVIVGETGCGKSTQIPQVNYFFKKILFEQKQEYKTKMYF